MMLRCIELRFTTLFEFHFLLSLDSIAVFWRTRNVGVKSPSILMENQVKFCACMCHPDLLFATATHYITLYLLWLVYLELNALSVRIISILIKTHIFILLAKLRRPLPCHRHLSCCLPIDPWKKYTWMNRAEKVSTWVRANECEALKSEGERSELSLSDSHFCQTHKVLA